MAALAEDSVPVLSSMRFADFCDGLNVTVCVNAADGVDPLAIPVLNLFRELCGGMPAHDRMERFGDAEEGDAVGADEGDAVGADETADADELRELMRLRAAHARPTRPVNTRQMVTDRIASMGSTIAADVDPCFQVLRCREPATADTANTVPAGDTAGLTRELAFTGAEQRRIAQEHAMMCVEIAGAVSTRYHAAVVADRADDDADSDDNEAGGTAPATWLPESSLVCFPVGIAITVPAAAVVGPHAHVAIPVAVWTPRLCTTVVFETSVMAGDAAAVAPAAVLRTAAFTHAVVAAFDTVMQHAFPPPVDFAIHHPDAPADADDVSAAARAAAAAAEQPDVWNRADVPEWGTLRRALLDPSFPPATMPAASTTVITMPAAAGAGTTTVTQSTLVPWSEWIGMWGFGTFEPVVLTNVVRACALFDLRAADVASGGATTTMRALLDEVRVAPTVVHDSVSGVDVPLAPAEDGAADADLANEPHVLLVMVPQGPLTVATVRTARVAVDTHVARCVARQPGDDADDADGSTVTSAVLLNTVVVYLFGGSAGGHAWPPEQQHDACTHVPALVRTLADGIEADLEVVRARCRTLHADLVRLAPDDARLHDGHLPTVVHRAVACIATPGCTEDIFCMFPGCTLVVPAGGHAHVLGGDRDTGLYTQLGLMAGRLLLVADTAAAVAAVRAAILAVPDTAVWLDDARDSLAVVLADT
jgi:hypothetical protein